MDATSFEGHIINYDEKSNEWVVHGKHFGIFESLKLAKKYVHKNNEAEDNGIEEEMRIQAEMDALQSQYEAEDEAREMEFINSEER